MAPPITLFTGPWADLPFEEVARLASEWGYEGLEIACWGDHLDVWRGAEDDAYIAGRKEILDRYGLSVYAISNHLKGQAVCDDPIDTLQALVWGDGDPEGVRQRAAEEMKMTARTAARLGVDTVVGFTGSSVWKYVAMFPPASQELIDAGYADFAGRWNPILDVFDEVGVRFAHEVHPSEIAYDYWTTTRALEAIGHRPAFGLNWDPSHFVWQDLDPVGFMWDFRDRIYHVDCKDAKGLGLRLHRARRRAVGGQFPDDEYDRLHRTHLRGMGGRGHGPIGGRPGGPGIRPPDGFRSADSIVRCGIRQPPGGVGPEAGGPGGHTPRATRTSPELPR